MVTLPLVTWVNEPTMNTELPVAAMSQISPLEILGMSVLGTLGTSLVWPGTGCAATAGVVAARTGSSAATIAVAATAAVRARAFICRAPTKSPVPRANPDWQRTALTRV